MSLHAQTMAPITWNIPLRTHNNIQPSKYLDNMFLGSHTHVSNESSWLITACLLLIYKWQSDGSPGQDMLPELELIVDSCTLKCGIQWT